jgi:hypothetical protein
VNRSGRADTFCPTPPPTVRFASIAGIRLRGREPPVSANNGDEKPSAVEEELRAACAQFANLIKSLRVSVTFAMTTAGPPL